MNSPGRAFVIALGRASERSVRRYLSGLQTADKDDVIANAVAWCWENQASYNVTISLETWFFGAVRNAYRAWKRGESRQAAELVEVLPSIDDTSAVAEARSALESLKRSLTEQEWAVADLRRQGRTRSEIKKQLGITKREFDDAARRIRGFRGLTPEPSRLQLSIESLRYRTPPAGSSDDDKRGRSTIDTQIENYLHAGLRGFRESMFSDDYRPGERVRIPVEDIRGRVYRQGTYQELTVVDYEGDEPNRRLLVTSPNTTSWWIAERYI